MKQEPYSAIETILDQTSIEDEELREILLKRMTQFEFNANIRLSSLKPRKAN